jgi:hypothetical protein
MGSGTNYVDGGANAGTTPWGSKAADTLDVFVANSTAANAVTVTQLTSGMSGTDATAYTDGYTAKVTSGSDVNYIKNIEARQRPDLERCQQQWPKGLGQRRGDVREDTSTLCRLYLKIFPLPVHLGQRNRHIHG